MLSEINSNHPVDFENIETRRETMKQRNEKSNSNRSICVLFACLNNKHSWDHTIWE